MKNGSFFLTRMIHDGVKVSHTDPRKRGKKTMEGTDCLGLAAIVQKTSKPLRKADLWSAGLTGVWADKHTRQLTGLRRLHLPAPVSGHSRFFLPCLETNITSVQPCVHPAAHGSCTDDLRPRARDWVVYGGKGLRARCDGRGEVFAFINEVGLSAGACCW